MAKAGRYGGTYAQKDLAFEFASWVSPKFKLYLIRDYQHLKADEQRQIGWSAKRELAKINYRIHTDAIQNNLIPPAVSRAQMNIIYANEADVLNVALGNADADDDGPGVAVAVTTPDGGSVSVPEAWLTGFPDVLTAANGFVSAAVANLAANGRKVWECYVLGLDPESNDATNDFRIVSFPLKADGTPDLENIEFDPPQSKWNVSGARPVLKGAATLDAADWPEVTEQNKASFRFFKVEVEMP